MKKIVIVDIDGTISKVGDRLKYLKKIPKDWDSFYEACDEDEPIHEILNLVSLIIESDDYEVVFCTGRRESVEEKTMDWLFDQGIKRGFILLMRKNGDLRHDTEIKPELLKEAGIDFDDIAFVLEDRNSMVKKWRDIGLICLQVADGDF